MVTLWEKTLSAGFSPAAHYLDSDILNRSLFLYNGNMNLQLLEYVKNNFSEPGKALDLGCGEGKDMRGLEKAGWACDGVDLKTGTDLNLPYLSKKAPYDLVYSNYVIHKLNRPKVLVATIKNNLVGGGRFFIQTFHNTDQYAHRAFSEEELAKILESEGLEVENIFSFPFDEGAPDFHHHIVLQATGRKR